MASFQNIAGQTFEDFGGDDLRTALLGRLNAGSEDPRNLVFQAGRDARLASTGARQRAARNRSRYGIAAPPGSEFRSALGGSLGELDALNRAQGAHGGLQDNILEYLASHGVAQRRMGLGALGEAGSLAQQETNASRQRRANRRSRNVGLGTSALTMALMLI